MKKNEKTLEELINDEEAQTLKLLKDKNISYDDLKKILAQKGVSEPISHYEEKVPFNSKRLKFGVISDLHMGHQNFREDILEHAIKYFRHQKVEFVLIPGDILEGMSGREGHIYELKYIGATNQLNYGVEMLSQIEQPMYAITAKNSHDGWFSSKNDMGFEVGPELERRIKNFKFLGYDEADLNLDNGLIIRMTHPGGGTSYAISYQLQKYINSISGGKKPHLLFEGHYHKAEYIFYRNIHAYDAGTLQEQTIYMRKKHSPAMLGYWVIDVRANKQGVDSVRSEFVPFYE